MTFVISSLPVAMSLIKKAFADKTTAFYLAFFFALFFSLAQNAACAQSTGDSEHTVNVGGKARTYLLHVPPSLTKPAPLVLLFHGGGGRSAGTEKITMMDRVADEHGFLLALPQGVALTWNDGGSDLGQNPPRDDVAFTRQMVEDIAAQFPIDRKKIFACGFSNGATFSMRLALEDSDLIAAAGIVCGGMYEKHQSYFANAKPISILMIVGTSDPCFPFNGGLTTAPKMGGVFQGAHHGNSLSAEQSLAFWRKIDHCAETPQTNSLPHRTQDNTSTAYKIWKGEGGHDVAELIVNGGGHCWPGGLQYFPVSVIGKTTYDFSASEALWRFFEAHDKQ